MVEGVLKIALFNFKTAVAGRVTLLRPNMITKEITLLSRVISVAATGIPLLARILCGSGSALELVRFSLY